MRAVVLMVAQGAHAGFIIIVAFLLGILLFPLIDLLSAILAVGIANTQAAHLMVSIVHGREGALIPILPIPFFTGILMGAGVHMMAQGALAGFILTMAFLLGMLLFPLVESLTAIFTVGIANTQAAHLMGSIVHRCKGTLIPILPIPIFIGVPVGTGVHMMAPGAHAGFIIIVVFLLGMLLFPLIDSLIAIFTIGIADTQAAHLMVSIVHGRECALIPILPIPTLIDIPVGTGVHMVALGAHAGFIVTMAFLLGIFLFPLVESLTAILAVGKANTQAAHLMGSIVHGREGAMTPILPIPTLMGILVGTGIHMVAQGAFTILVIGMFSVFFRAQIFVIYPRQPLSTTLAPQLGIVFPRYGVIAIVLGRISQVIIDPPPIFNRIFMGTAVHMVAQGALAGFIVIVTVCFRPSFRMFRIIEPLTAIRAPSLRVIGPGRRVIPIIFRGVGRFPDPAPLRLFRVQVLAGVFRFTARGRFPPTVHVFIFIEASSGKDDRRFAGIFIIPAKGVVFMSRCIHLLLDLAEAIRRNGLSDRDLDIYPRSVEVESNDNCGLFVKDCLFVAAILGHHA